MPPTIGAPLSEPIRAAPPAAKTRRDVPLAVGAPRACVARPAIAAEAGRSVPSRAIAASATVGITAMPIVMTASVPAAVVVAMCVVAAAVRALMPPLAIMATEMVSSAPMRATHPRRDEAARMKCTEPTM